MRENLRQIKKNDSQIKTRAIDTEKNLSMLSPFLLILSFFNIEAKKFLFFTFRIWISFTKFSLKFIYEFLYLKTKTASYVNVDLKKKLFFLFT